MIPASHVCILSASLFNNVHLYNLYSLLKSGYFFPTHQCADIVGITDIVA